MKTRLLFFLILSLTGLFALPLSADAEPGTDIRSLIVLGLEYNIGLQIREIDAPLAKEDMIFEAAAFDPELFSGLKISETSNPYASSFSTSDSDDSHSLSAQVGLGKRFSLGTTANVVFSTERKTGNDIFNDFSPSYRTSLLLDLTQPLLRDAGSQVNLSSLALSRDVNRQSQLSIFLQAQSLARGIADLAYQIAAADQIVALRQEAVALAERTFQANRKRFAVGVIPVSEVQQAETALADRELKLSLARQNRELLFEELNRQVNQRLPKSPDDLEIETDTESAKAPLPDFEILYAQARQNRLDLQINRVDLHSAAIQKEYYRNQTRPRLDLQFQAGVNGLSGERRDSGTASSYQGDWFDSTGSMLEADGYQWGVGLQFRLPLGNRQAEARLRQASLQEKRSRFQQRDLEEQLRTELVQQLTNLKRYDEQLMIARKFEALAKLSLEQEQRRLDEGLSDTFRILSFQDKMIDARIGRIEAATQVRRNRVLLDFSRGKILESFEITVKTDPEGMNNENI